jgi:peptidoglycan-associated lipoprotein
MLEKKMKIFRLMLITAFSLIFCMLTACSHFKSGNKKNESAQTSGLGEQEGFGGENFSENRLKAPYNQTYLFDFNKYDVGQDDVGSIDVQANYLTEHTNAKVRVEGNADERGSREYNIALGWKRAKAIAEILKQHGVNDKQIAMVSYGKEKPVALGHDESSYSQNRRADLVYEAK